jgi:hypothetical protein
MNNKHELDSYVAAGLKLLGEVISATYKEGSPCDNVGSFFQNEVFTMNSYNWNDDSDPNFSCDGFDVYWYKHFGRGTYSNKQISFEDWMVIFTKCLNSIQKKSIS